MFWGFRKSYRIAFVFATRYWLRTDLCVGRGYKFRKLKAPHFIQLSWAYKSRFLALFQLRFFGYHYCSSLVGMLIAFSCGSNASKFMSQVLVHVAQLYLVDRPLLHVNPMIVSMLVLLDIIKIVIFGLGCILVRTRQGLGEFQLVLLGNY